MWFYLFTTHDQFPDPLEEIDALAALDEEGQEAFLRLSPRPDAPLRGAAPGERVHLCTRTGGAWSIWGHGHVEGPARQGETPPSVLPVYGPAAAGQWWRQLAGIVLYDHPRGETEVGLAAGSLPRQGQAYVVRLPPAESHAPPSPAVTSPSAGPTLPAPRLSNLAGKRFVGIDLTAGTWESRLNEGGKPFYSVCIEADETNVLRLAGVETFTRLDRLLDHPWLTRAAWTVIDGPCAANGIRLKADRTGFEFPAPGVREAERGLARMGVKLFWTTENTLRHFAGTREWIARSLALFADLAGRGLGGRSFEVHPHAVFTLLQRSLRPGRPLAAKAAGQGREGRLALLRAFVPVLPADELPDHDAVDSAAAALMGALRESGHARPVGDDAGGPIWVPDLPPGSGEENG